MCLYSLQMFFKSSLGHFNRVSCLYPLAPSGALRCPFKLQIEKAPCFGVGATRGKKDPFFAPGVLGPRTIRPRSKLTTYILTFTYVAFSHKHGKKMKKSLMENFIFCVVKSGHSF